MLLKRQINLNIKILKAEIVRLEHAIEPNKNRKFANEENTLNHIKKMQKQILDIKEIIKSYQ